MRNPPWHRDEIILALDLYSRLDPGQIHARNPEVIELSRLLNRLPIFDVKPDEAKFRNPNGVGLKLSNFLAIDPDYAGKGMQSFSQLDKKVFEEFQFDEEKLHRIANQIRQIARNQELPNKLNTIPEFETEDESEMFVMEGSTLYKLHKYRERDPKIIQKKKQIEWNQQGKFICEACTFDFQIKYGDLGHKYIECHHRTPLAETNDVTKTSLNDLALVCSNCHRMLHRKIDTLSVEGLRQIIAAAS